MSPQSEAKIVEVLTEIAHRMRDFTDTSVLHAEVLRAQATLAQHADRLGRVEGAVANADETYVEDLKKKLLAQEGSAQHWSRYVIGVVVSLALIVFSAALGYAMKK